MNIACILTPDPRTAKTKRFWNNLIRKVALANKERRDEYAWALNFGKDIFDLRLLFPEGFTDVAEYAPPAQLSRVLADWHGRLIVQICAVPKYDQGGICKAYVAHELKLARLRSNRKPSRFNAIRGYSLPDFAGVLPFLLNLFASRSVLLSVPNE